MSTTIAIEYFPFATRTKSKHMYIMIIQKRIHRTVEQTNISQKGQRQFFLSKLQSTFAFF